MPFSVDAFFEVFARYNQAIWPLQVAAYAGGLIVAALLLRPSRPAAIMIGGILAAMWAVNGIGYHWSHFAAINPAARLFAGLFVAEAALLAGAPLALSDLRFSARRDVRTGFALALIVFAAIVYPLWGMAAGHVYPAMPAFGVAPCPTTIFTIGVLLMGEGRRAAWLLAIPAMWALIGGSAAVLLDVPQDFGLLAALFILLALAAGRWFRRKPGGI